MGGGWNVRESRAQPLAWRMSTRCRRHTPLLVRPQSPGTRLALLFLTPPQSFGENQVGGGGGPDPPVRLSGWFSTEHPDVNGIFKKTHRKNEQKNTKKSIFGIEAIVKPAKISKNVHFGFQSDPWLALRSSTGKKSNKKFCLSQTALHLINKGECPT